MEASKRDKAFLGFALAALAMVAVVGAGVLYFFDPATVGLYPVCYFHRFTGLQCPGCGGLRATHQLLHGNVGAAWRLNSMVLVAAPVFVWLCARFIYLRLRGRPASFELRPRWLWTALGLLVVYGIARNLV